MSANEYTPTPEAVEREAQSLQVAAVRTCSWGNAMSLRRDEWVSLASFILTRQHAREQLLLDALYFARGYGCDHPSLWERANRALAAHAALDAAPEPTLLEAAKALLPSTAFLDVGCHIAFVQNKDWDALKAAVERAEKGATS